MAQIPDHQAIVLVHQTVGRLHIVQVTCAIVHMGQHDHSRFIVDCGLQVSRIINQLQPIVFTKEGVKPFNDVQIRRERIALGQNHFLLRMALFLQIDGRGQHLEQVHGGAVADDGFALAGTNQRRHLVAQTHGQGPPAGFVPAIDQVGAPFLANHFLGALHGVPGHGAQGVSVQINRIGWQVELGFEGSQFIGLIPLLALLQGNHVHAPRFCFLRHLV